MCACMHLNIDFLPRSVYIYTQGMLVLGELVLQLQFVNVWPRRMFHSTGRENVNRHAVSSHVCIYWRKINVNTPFYYKIKKGVHCHSQNFFLHLKMFFNREESC